MDGKGGTKKPQAVAVCWYINAIASKIQRKGLALINGEAEETKAPGAGCL